MRDLQSLLTNAPVLITVQRGEDLRVESINVCARNAMGGRDLVGKALAEVFPRLEPWRRKVADVVLSGRAYIGVDEPFTLDWRGDGRVETRYLTSVCQPLLSTGGTVEGSVLFAIDVTDSVLRRARHPHDASWLEAAFDAIATPIVLAEPGSRRILFANAAARQLSHGDLPGGRTFGQAIGLDTGFYCTDAAGSRIPDDELPAARASRGERVEAMDLLWHTPFGVIPLVCFAEEVAATESLPSLIVLSFFDVSKARRLERELLEEMALRDDFANLIGHELRTPLTALKLQTESMRKQYPQAAGLCAIERATARMQVLTEQIIESARIRERGVSLEPQELDLCGLVDEVIEGLRSEAKRVRTPIERVGAVSARGRWDRIRLKHVLTNLLCNSLRFGAGAPVTVECRDLGDRASVTVTDHGIGIDPAHHGRIFERYGRGVSARNFGGLGLGLWITREIVNQMKGTIAVRSSLGNGAAFTVELPKDAILAAAVCAPISDAKTG